MKIKSYTSREEEKAIKDYSEIEKKNRNNKNFDTVLIGADSFRNMERAYPNYFLDIKEFLDKIKDIIKKY